MERRYDAEGRLIIDWDDVMDGARPATADDVTILRDGRRLDTAEKVRAFVAEFEAEYPHLRRDREPAQR